MGKPLCISSDSHIVESVEFFEPLAKLFGDRAPHVVTADPAKGPQLDLGNGKLGIGLSGFLMANVDFASGEAAKLAPRGYDLARPGCYDTVERLKDQDLDGIDGEVIYPSILFNVYQIDDIEIVKASFRLYNDWIADYCKEQPDRLFALAAIQLYDLDDAIIEMARAKAMGHVGVCIPATAPPDRLYSDPWYDKFWAAAQDMNMSLNMHVFTGATDNHGLPPAMKLWPVAALCLPAQMSSSPVYVNGSPTSSSLSRSLRPVGSPTCSNAWTGAMSAAAALGLRAFQ
jgi:hypothetical protein